MDTDQTSESPSDRATQSPLPCLTADLPGIGGTIKQSPDDFVVEEIPAYEPCGTGDHLFLFVEKRDVSAEQLTRHIARSLQISSRDVGVAGLKDRAAITRQWVSVPAGCLERVGAVQTDSIRVLRHDRHGNKLRTGHLRGNRFSILLRDVGDDAMNSAEQIAGRIGEHGFPNYFGSQRFGYDGENLRTGLDLLAGRISERALSRTRRRFLLRFSISAVQSQLFNLALSERLGNGTLTQVQPGDIMQVVATGGQFTVEGTSVEQSRFNAGETAITGPIFGPKMTQPTGEPARQEAELLAAFDLRLDDFQRFGKLARGTRRAYLVRPQELVVEQEPTGLRFRFTLPAGTYATSLLREFQKND